MAILAILLFALTSIIGDVSNRWQSAFARVNNFSKARVSLDIIGNDLARAILTPNLPAFPTSSGQSALRFLTETTSGGDRSLSLVDYRADGAAQATDPKKIGLWRESTPISFGETLPYFAADLEFTDFTTASRDDQLGPGVLLFRYQFVQNDGVLRDEYLFDFDNQSAVTSCRQIVVTLLVVDETALAQLVDAGQMTSFISQFSSTPPASLSYREHWQSVRDDASFMASMPRAARSGIEIYERAFPLQTSL